MHTLTRPSLHRIPLSAVAFAPGTVTITMSEGQWDALLAEAYRRGHTLLELDALERPIRAYRIDGSKEHCQCDICREERAFNE